MSKTSFIPAKLAKYPGVVKTFHFLDLFFFGAFVAFDKAWVMLGDVQSEWVGTVRYGVVQKVSYGTGVRKKKDDGSCIASRAHGLNVLQGIEEAFCGHRGRHVGLLHDGLLGLLCLYRCERARQSPSPRTSWGHSTCKGFHVRSLKSFPSQYSSKIQLRELKRGL